MSRIEDRDARVGPPALLAIYARERLSSPIVWLLIAVLSAGAVTLATSAASPRSIARSTTVVALLVIAFRVWDDLADRAHDRVAHPARVIVAARSTMPFAALSCALFAAAAGVLMTQLETARAPRLVVLAATTAIVAVASRLRGRGAGYRAAASYLLLLKYPLIVLVASAGEGSMLASRPPFDVLLLVGLYAAICLYETVADAELRSLYSKPARS